MRTLLSTIAALDIEKLLRITADKFGYTLARKSAEDPNAISFQNFVDFYLSIRGTATFVEIGANDGVTCDPLYPLIRGGRLRGVLLEPQREVFERLQKNYGQFPNVVCENVAIADEPGTKVLYTVKESYRTPENYARVTGLASFRREVIEKTLPRKLPPDANLNDYIEEYPVRCETLQGLLERHNLTAVDIIQIDCEGYDFEIIKQIDFSKNKPAIINYEHRHLSPSDRKECLALLEGHGYRWFNHAIDTCAYLGDFEQRRTSAAHSESRDAA